MMTDFLIRVLAGGAELLPLAAVVVAWLSQALVLGTLLAAVTWLLTATVLRSARPAIHGAFWTIVLVKFLIPAGPAWAFSLSNLIPYDAKPPGGGAVTAAASGGYPTWTGEMGGAVPLLVPVGGVADGAGPRPAAERGMSTTVFASLCAAYILAVGIVAVVRLRAYARFARHCGALPPADACAVAVVAAVCRRIGLRRMPRVRISDESPSPFVFGVLRPTLVLSSRQLESPSELEAVVLHELAHLRRGDLWIRQLQWIAGTLLFFWPVVAWVNRRLDLAREHACDEWALRHGRLSPGEYARCLLRAMRPAGGSSACRPAAMAANIKHVERRIDMIMNRGYENTRRGRGALAVVAVCGWACFVLTGASAPAAAAGANEEASAELRAVVKIVTDGDATPEADVLMLLGDAAVATEGAHIFMLAGPTAEEGSSGRFVQTWVSRPGEAQLAAFAERFPAADLDGDGKVSVQERDAFLAAMALAAPQQVLERFPHADRNGDGVLDADEAARLVTGALAPAEGMPTIEAIRLSKEHGESHPAGAHLLLEADSDPETAGDSVKMKVTLREDGDGTQRKEVVVRARPLGSDDARVEKSMEWIDKDGIRRQAQVRSMGPHPQIAPLVLAAQWIPENVAAAPTRDEAAALLAMVERAPLDFFLELNPAADLDGDGVLTAQERDEYLAKQMAEMRARLLERHPEADADGDGVLTQEEMKAYFARRRGMDGVFEMLDDEGGVRILKLRRNGAEASGSIRIEMEVVKPDEEE